MAFSVITAGRYFPAYYSSVYLLANTRSLQVLKAPLGDVKLTQA